MKTTNLVGKFTTLVAIALLGFVSSCKDEETVNVQDIADASSESLTDSYYQDADDVALYSLEFKNTAPGRTESDDYRIACAGITITPTEGSTQTSGTLVIDFGTNCIDAKGNVRKGKINLAYEGSVGSVGFSVAETFTDYYINGIKLEGTRTITRVEASNQDNKKHHIVLTDGKATWPDATFATRSADLYRELDVTAGTITITGSASGSGRKGKTYAMEIAEDVIHKMSCIADGIYMAVDGKKVFTINGTKQITIEYGDGTCDKVVTITINGLTKDVTIGKN
jgi:hypothetical protein